MSILMQSIVQIATATDAENGEVLYALDSHGNIWERVYERQPFKRHKRGTSGPTPEWSWTPGQTTGWMLVDLALSVPIDPPNEAELPQESP